MMASDFAEISFAVFPSLIPKPTPTGKLINFLILERLEVTSSTLIFPAPVTPLRETK